MAGIPSEAVGAFVGVLLYSSFSLFLISMLVGLLISYGETFTYVTIHSTFTAVSTFASIIQQIHYSKNWEAVKQAQFKKALRAITLPGLTFVGGAHPVDRTLFLIQFWCYNVMALNILFWSIALFMGAWGFRTPWLGNWMTRIGPISKGFSLVFPSVIVGLINADALLRSGMLTFVVENITMFFCLIAGSVLLVLILFKYMKTRRLASGSARRGRWWASQETKSQGSHDIGSHYTRGTGTISTRSSVYDKALIIRFTIGFVINAFFLSAIIMFTYLASTNTTAIIAAGQADLRPQSAIIDILLFIPGVTASLVTFLVFGTAKSWRQYRDLLVGGCGIRNRLIQRKFIRQQDRGDGGDDEADLEFATLPTLRTTPSLEERMKRDEATKRVKMFSTTTVVAANEPPSLPPKPRQNTTRLTVQETPRPNTATTGTCDGRSLDETTVANDRGDGDIRVKPLAPRPVEHQQRGVSAEESNQSNNMQFHRPRPSIGTIQSQAGSSGAPASAYGTINIQIEQGDRTTRTGKRQK